MCQMLGTNGVRKGLQALGEVGYGSGGLTVTFCEGGKVWCSRCFDRTTIPYLAKSRNPGRYRSADSRGVIQYIDLAWFASAS